jgi:hypothetical protein
VQHYIEELGNKDHCRVHSHSDSLSATGNTKLGVTWELKIKPLSDDSCEFSNHVIVSLTTEFSTMLSNAKIADLNPIKNRMQKNLELHNEEETPLFAKDIESKALKGIEKE